MALVLAAIKRIKTERIILAAVACVPKLLNLPCYFDVTLMF